MAAGHVSVCAASCSMLRTESWTSQLMGALLERLLLLNVLVMVAPCCATTTKWETQVCPPGAASIPTWKVLGLTSKKQEAP